jgi:hypothetical protein
MKKIIAREFLWFMVILVLAVPLAFAFLSALDLVAEGDNFTDSENDFIADLYLLAYGFIFMGLYLMRLIVLAVKVLSTPEPKKEK